MKIMKKYTRRASCNTCPGGPDRLHLEGFGKVMLMSAAALGMTAALTIQSSMAFFTTYVSGGGSHPVTLGAQTEIHEDVSDMTKHIVIRNTSETNDCYVRVKAFYAEPFEITYTDVGGGSGSWSLGENDFWYYSGILAPGETTGALDAKIEVPGDYDKDSFNVVVIQECTPVLYDENGSPYADWSMKYSDYEEEAR